MKAISLILLVVIVSSCTITYPFEIEEEFMKKQLEFKIELSEQQIQSQGMSLNYGMTNNVNAKVILLFIHGTPGSWYDFGRFMLFDSLVQRAQIISIDRPGWGQSKLHDLNGKPTVEPSFARQGDYISTLLKQLKQRPNPPLLVLVAHSLGVPIALQTSLDYPALVDGLLLLSGPIDPAIEQPRWYNHLSSLWPLNRLLPTPLVNSNIEIMAKHKQLAPMVANYSNIKIPITFMQGEKDTLVYPANMDFAERQFPAETTRIVRLPEQGHLLQLEQREKITEELLLLLQRL